MRRPQADAGVVGVFLRSVVQYGAETSEPGPWQVCPPLTPSSTLFVRREVGAFHRQAPRLTARIRRRLFKAPMGRASSTAGMCQKDGRWGVLDQRRRPVGAGSRLETGTRQHPARAFRGGGCSGHSWHDRREQIHLIRFESISGA